MNFWCSARSGAASRPSATSSAIRRVDTPVSPGRASSDSAGDVVTSGESIFGAAWGLAYFLGPLAGGWIYEEWGSSALWVGCLIVGVVSAFGYLALRAPARRQMAGTHPNPSPSD